MTAVPIYSSLLLAKHDFTGEASLEIPTGVVCVVRDIDAVVGISSGGTLWAYDNAGVQFWGYTFGTVLAGKQTASWRGRQVLVGPDYLHVSTDFSGDFRVSGYLFNNG